MLSKLSFENDLINNDKLTHLIFSSNKQKRLNEKSYLKTFKRSTSFKGGI